MFALDIESIKTFGFVKVFSSTILFQIYFIFISKIDLFMKIKHISNVKTL